LASHLIFTAAFGIVIAFIVSSVQAIAKKIPNNRVVVCFGILIAIAGLDLYLDQ
jgi:hypothetical protein